MHAARVVFVCQWRDSFNKRLFTKAAPKSMCFQIINSHHEIIYCNESTQQLCLVEKLKHDKITFFGDCLVAGIL